MEFSLLLILLNVINLKYKVSKLKSLIYLISFVHFSFFFFIHLNYLFCTIIFKILKFTKNLLGTVLLIISLIFFNFDIAIIFVIYHVLICLFILLIIPFFGIYFYSENPLKIESNIKMHKYEYECFLKIALFFTIEWEYGLIQSIFVCLFFIVIFLIFKINSHQPRYLSLHEYDVQKIEFTQNQLKSLREFYLNNQINFSSMETNER